MMTCEVWTPVNGWPVYWVSTEGRVIRAWDRFGNWVGRELMGFWTKGGYRRVRLHDGKGGHADRFFQHVVLEAWIGMKPDPDAADFKPNWPEILPAESIYEALHMNGKPGDNRLENLRWGTLEENYEDQRICGTAAIGEKNGMSKLSDLDRDNICKSHEHRTVLAKKYNVDESTIRRTRRKGRIGV